MGDGTTINRTMPVPVSGLTDDVVAVAAGEIRRLGLKRDGTVWAWGHNWAGQLGDDTRTTRLTPVLVTGLTDVVATAAGAAHSLTVKHTANATPLVDAGGPYEVDEGRGVTLQGSGSSDPDGDLLTYAWDLDGDGSYGDATGATPTFDAAGLDGPSSLTVALQVSDDEGLTSTDPAEITIQNVPPTITEVTNSGPIIVGEQVILTVTASDPAGDNDPLSYAFDCDNDGTYEVGPQSEHTAVCTPSSAGLATIGIRVSDDDAGVATAQEEVEVLSPQQAIDRLRSEVQALVVSGALNRGQGNALQKSLDNAQASLDRGNERAAVNQLEAFVNQVQGYINGNVLTKAEGQPLIDLANRIIAVLQ